MGNIMFKEKLQQTIQKKSSLLCVGLDPDISRIPKHLLQEKDPLYIFNREVITATREYAAAYKPNIAFYESLGSAGWDLLEESLSLIPKDSIIIADAKRGDIGNTSRKYAETFFKVYNFDAITVAPYMGYDSISPFLDFEDKGIFILCLTSNEGSRDFQYISSDSEPLYVQVAKKANEWNLKYGNCGLVVGATHPEDLEYLRSISPNLPFLIPGIGAQGGDLPLTIQFGTDHEGGSALINASRSVIYASNGSDFAAAAEKAAKSLRDNINSLLSRYNKNIISGRENG